MSLEPRLFLVVGNNSPVPDPSWDLVEAAGRDVRPNDHVALVRADRTHIRADGARSMYTIVFYKTASTPPLLIGRRAGGARRGKATLSDNRVLVSSLELWRDDGLAVFRAFYEGQPLEDAFDLRDPRTEYSDEQIQDFLSG